MRRRKHRRPGSIWTICFFWNIGGVEKSWLKRKTSAIAGDIHLMPIWSPIRRH
ncbi:hypothetical protein KCP70_16365 [Salmonella enterica subsp. enterica]|nr:hypothetical protein KCP70_16365 [Salmonella enterica subsp. enterica]